MPPRLLAISDLHVDRPDNAAFTDGLAPADPADWLIVAGDVSHTAGTIVDTLARLAGRFARVLWTPGNHDLWTMPGDPLELTGEARYRWLARELRGHGVLTPEDPYPQWDGPGGPVVVAPVFTLYDYSFRPAGAATKEEGLQLAREARIVASDEMVLHPDPYPSREAWCAARVAETESRLAAIDPELPTVLAAHFPLVREPTAVLRFPVFAQWCGTTLTREWPVRYRALAVVYGHLHIPRSITVDGVPHHEVSLGYPREWQRRPFVPRAPLSVLG